MFGRVGRQNGCVMSVRKRKQTPRTQGDDNIRTYLEPGGPATRGAEQGCEAIEGTYKATGRVGGKTTEVK